MAGVILTDGQLTVLADMLAARIDAVLPAFRVDRFAGVTVEVHERLDWFCEELIIRVPIRRAEYVG